MAVGIWLTAVADNTVTLTSTQGHPGEEVEVAVMLANESAVTALEVCIPLDDALCYVDGSAVINVERANGHQLTAAVKEGTLNIVIFSSTLAPLQGTEGKVCSFKVKLGKEPATYSLIPQVVMCDATGVAIPCGVVSGAVTLLSPKIEVSAPVIDFGKYPIRGSYTRTLTLRNSGNETLHISNIAFDREDLKADVTSCAIAAGKSRNITLTYKPLQRGEITSNITIASNAINFNDGKAIVKAQPYSVNELHVQRVEGVSDEEVTVVLKMNNMEPIAGAQCEFTLPDALKYVEGSAAAGARCEETDHAASGFMQGKKLTLILYSSSNTVLPEGDGELMTFRVSLMGQSGSYRLDPKEVVLGNAALENMTSATKSECVVIKSPKLSGAAELDMGAAPITQNATATYNIKNSGQVDLVISKVTFLSEGYAIEDALPITIAPKESKSLAVLYKSTAEGVHKTTMQVYTNDPTNRLQSVAVSGKVYEPNLLIVKGENIQDGYRLNVSLDNYSEIVAVQMVVNGFSESMSIALAERLKNHSYMLTPMGDGKYQILIYSMDNASISGNKGLLMTIDCEAEDYFGEEVTLEDIVLSDAKGRNYTSGDMVLHTARLWGDADGNYVVNLLDLNLALSNIFGNKVETENINMLQMDANDDGSINILDVNVILRTMLGVDRPLAAPHRRNEQMEQVVETENVL